MFCFILKLKEQTLLQLVLSLDIIIMTADILIQYRLEHFDNNDKACVIMCNHLFICVSLDINSFVFTKWRLIYLTLFLLLVTIVL